MLLTELFHCIMLLLRLKRIINIIVIIWNCIMLHHARTIFTSRAIDLIFDMLCLICCDLDVFMWCCVHNLLVNKLYNIWYNIITIYLKKKSWNFWATPWLSCLRSARSVLMCVHTSKSPFNNVHLAATAAHYQARMSVILYSQLVVVHAYAVCRHEVIVSYPWLLVAFLFIESVYIHTNILYVFLENLADYLIGSWTYHSIY